MSITAIIRKSQRTNFPHNTDALISIELDILASESLKLTSKVKEIIEKGGGFVKLKIEDANSPETHELCAGCCLLARMNK